jgi:hypothetical protein
VDVVCRHGEDGDASYVTEKKHQQLLDVIHEMGDFLFNQKREDALNFKEAQRCGNVG